MTQHLEQTFKSAVLTSLYPRSQIDIYVEVNVGFCCFDTVTSTAKQLLVFWLSAAVPANVVICIHCMNNSSHLGEINDTIVM